MNLYTAVYNAIEKAKERQHDRYKYRETWFYAIDEKENISFSKDIYSISSSTCCILIHFFSKLAVINWYDDYSVEYIDPAGISHIGSFGDEYEVRIDGLGCTLKQLFITLSNTKYSLYTRSWDNPDRMLQIWELYKQLKSCNSDKEVILTSKVFWYKEELDELKRKIDILEQKVLSSNK